MKVSTGSGALSACGIEVEGGGGWAIESVEVAWGFIWGEGCRSFFRRLLAYNYDGGQREICTWR